LNFLKIKYPEVTKANKTLFLMTYAGKPLSIEMIKDNMKIIQLVSPNSMHPGDMDASGDDCSDVELAVSTECVDTLLFRSQCNDDDVTSQSCQSVFFTDIAVDCWVAVAFVDRWYPDIVVKVLYAQRVLVNVMHPVQDIHSWKASLVPNV